MSAVVFDAGAIRSAFDRFLAPVEARPGRSIRGLDEGLAAVREGCKPRLHNHAFGLPGPGC